MRLLAVDPGKTTGWALFESSVSYWQFINMGIRDTHEEVYDLLKAKTPDILVVEDYRLYPWKSNAQMWSQFTTTKLIGAMEYFCWEHSVQMFLQGASNKSIGYKNGQIPQLPKSNPINHAHDAKAHGYYYIVNKLKGVVREQ